MKKLLSIISLSLLLLTGAILLRSANTTGANYLNPPSEGIGWVGSDEEPMVTGDAHGMNWKQANDGPIVNDDLHGSRLAMGPARLEDDEKTIKTDDSHGFTFFSEDSEI